MDMDIEPDLLSPSHTPKSGAAVACPLRLAMERIAWAALRQHVLYLEGECQPRLELVRDLETSTTLERLIRRQVCPISRSCPLEPDELASAVDALRCWELHSALATCAAARACPLDA
jgi:hypothetical protein